MIRDWPIRCSACSEAAHNIFRAKLEHRQESADVAPMQPVPAISTPGKPRRLFKTRSTELLIDWYSGPVAQMDRAAVS